MRPILGGNVPTELVIGRDEFIDKLWKKLENQSIVLVSERRIGKTSVIRKMSKEPRPNWHPIFMVIEGVRSPTEFIAKIYHQVTSILSLRSRSLNGFIRICEQFAGAKFSVFELPQLKQHWKDMLKVILEDIKENFDERVVFLWDEFPLMISNIQDDCGHKVAMDLLNELRDYRVEDDSGKIRTLYTGSIGLHLVVKELIREGFKNDPTNDMFTFSLEGLEDKYARELACQVLQGLVDDGEIKISDSPKTDKGTGLNSLDAIAQTIAKSTDGLPFYINHTVDWLSEIERPIEIVDVERAIDSLITDPDDRAHFGHYAERIEVYYLFGEKVVELAFSILNILCQEEQPMSEEQIWDRVMAKIEFTDKNFFQDTLAMLVKDHYLQRHFHDERRAYRFKYEIIRKWWLKIRG